VYVGSVPPGLRPGGILVTLKNAASSAIVLAIARVNYVGNIAHSAIEIDHTHQCSLRCCVDQASTLQNGRHLLRRVNKGPKTIPSHPSQEVLKFGDHACTSDREDRRTQAVAESGPPLHGVKFPHQGNNRRRDPEL